MDYLQIREDYKLAYHRWEQCAEKLCQMLHCDFATLEQALLVPRCHRHAALVQEYARLGIALDQASDRSHVGLVPKATDISHSQVNHWAPRNHQISGR